MKREVRPDSPVECLSGRLRYDVSLFNNVLGARDGRSRQLQRATRMSEFSNPLHSWLITFRRKMGYFEP